MGTWKAPTVLKYSKSLSFSSAEGDCLTQISLIFPKGCLRHADFPEGMPSARRSKNRLLITDY